MLRSVRPYPMRGAHFVPVDELGLWPSELPGRPHDFNNHHYAFTAKQMGRLLITQTFRDLNRNQLVLPKDVHCELHQVYSPPELPDLGSLMDVIDEAYQNRETLRYGPAGKPRFEQITDKLIWRLGIEYNGAA